MKGGGAEGAGIESDVITAGWDSCLKVWDVETGINKTTMVRGQNYVLSMLSRSADLQILSLAMSFDLHVTFMTKFHESYS